MRVTAQRFAMNISSGGDGGGGTNYATAGGGITFIHSAGDHVRYLQTRLFPICTLPDRGTLLLPSHSSSTQHEREHLKSERMKKKYIYIVEFRTE